MRVEGGGEVGGLDLLHQDQVYKTSHAHSRNTDWTGQNANGTLCSVRAN